jgi:hypothetical protein
MFLDGSIAMTFKSFLKNLFDINFKEFVTKSVIKYFYLFIIIAMALGSLFFLIASIAKGGGDAFLAIFLAPIGFIIYLLVVRIWLELILIIFRISDNIQKMVPANAESEPVAPDIPDAPDTTGEAEK